MREDGGERAQAMAKTVLEELDERLRTIEPSGGGVRGVARDEGRVWKGVVHH